MSKRLKNGKEDPSRISERQGIASQKRPAGFLIWVHAASVGEAQSALKIIDEIYKTDSTIIILITTGTRTSAQLISAKDKPNTIHQYVPFDHPKWVERFINHWQPDAAIWIESELWPNMLSAVRKKNIPALLINARLSKKTYKKWSFAPSFIKSMLSTFSKILCQTEQDALLFKKLGHTNTCTTDNIKYSASPLSYEVDTLKELKSSTNSRKIILYASTHDGEEIMAADIHKKLSSTIQNLLTIIVPRHPERGQGLLSDLSAPDINTVLRSNQATPQNNTDIYIVDTLGELGLFYRLSPVAYIGRSLSNDGGGGHNPIEAALLDTAILCGPNVQNLQDIYTQMIDQKAIIQVQNEDELENKIQTFFENKEVCDQYKKSAARFIETKNHIIQHVMDDIKTLLLPQDKPEN